MATTPTPPDPYMLTNAKFQEFVQWMPHAPLRERGISRASFNSVAYALSRHGKFKTGEDIRISQAGLVEESGCSHNTVRKVIQFLKDECKVLEVVGVQRRQGTPSENYRFRKNPLVQEVIDLKNRGPKPVSTKKKRDTKKKEAVSVDSLHVSVDTLSEPVDSLHVSVDTLSEPVDNNKGIKAHRAIESSVEESPSPAPVVALPSARDGAAIMAQEEEGFDVDDFLEGLVIDL